MRDAGDPSHGGVFSSRMPRCFNEAGVRDAGDQALGHAVELELGRASTRPACETPEINTPAFDPVPSGVGFNEAGVRDAGDPPSFRPVRRCPQRFNEAGVRDAGDRGRRADDSLQPAASTRPACETPEISFDVPFTREMTGLQRGRRARRRRSFSGMYPNIILTWLQRGRRARRRRSSDAVVQVRHTFELQRGRRARRRRSQLLDLFVLLFVVLQRGRRARRRRSRTQAFNEMSARYASTRPACETPEISTRRSPRSPFSTSFNEAGVRDAGDRARSSYRARGAWSFNEAGVRDAGDRDLEHRVAAPGTASTRPACETPEIPRRPRVLPQGRGASTRPACETPEIMLSVATNAVTILLQRGRRARRRRSPSPTGALDWRNLLQRGRRARRRRSGGSVSSVRCHRALQRGRRARRRRSYDIHVDSDSDHLLQRGRRARRRRSLAIDLVRHLEAPASTRPACETPEIASLGSSTFGGEIGFNEAGVRDAGDPARRR